MRFTTILSLVLLLFSKQPLQAQQTEADLKLLADIRAKAERGDDQAQLTLGSAFYFGSLGLTKDHKEAIHWWRKAAAQNLAEAQFNLVW